VVVLDAYSLIALLTNGRAAGEVEELIKGGSAAATGVNVAEAADVTQRLYGAPPDLVERELEAVFSEVVLLDVGTMEALIAARLRARHCHRREAPLSLADCFLLAAARPDDSVATSDPAVAEVARLKGIEVVALPDSAGRRPS
jgi:predicted nucleic acid-binding protein